jgi:acyl carrier protein
MQPHKTPRRHIWSEAEIFAVLKDMLPRVAPLKVTRPVFPETSLAQDLDFDSLDTIEMLIAINKEFAVTLDFEAWLAEESEREGSAFTIRSLCRCILRALEGDAAPGRP